MKKKWPDFLAGIGGEALTPEDQEFDREFRAQLQYVKANPEWIAYQKTLDSLEHRQRDRVKQIEHILDERGVRYEDPGYEQHFNSVWEQMFPNAWEPGKMSDPSPDPAPGKEDFEPEM